MRRRRRAGVGLLGTMAGGGVAYAAGSRAASGSVADQAQLDAQHDAPSGEKPMDDKIAQLQELAELRTAGVLTEAEFASQKARLLES